MKYYILFLAFIFLHSPQSYAQNSNSQCFHRYEIIFPIREPVFDRPFLWQNQIKELGYASYKDISVYDDRGIIIAGEKETPTETGSDKTIFLMTTTFNGKVRWIKEDKSNKNASMVSMILEKNEIIIAGSHKEKNNEKIRISYYNKKGDYKSQKFITDKDFNLEIIKMIKVNEEKSTDKLLIVWAKNKRLPTDTHTRIYRINKNAKVIWKRSFIPGLTNKLLDIQPTQHGQYLAGGLIEIDENRIAGWLLKIGKTGEIIWEKNIPRGKKTIINSIAITSNDKYIISGGSVPYGKRAKKAGFVIKIDNSSNIIWQRFYTGQYNYNSFEVSAEKDGRVQLIIDAKPLKPWENGFFKIINISSNGYIIDDENYETGNDATIYKMIIDKEGKRYLAGYTRKGYSKRMIEEGIRQKTFLNAMVMALPALPTYQNPCKKKTLEYTYD